MARPAGDASPEEAKSWFELARSRGVNHLDIAPQYGAAESVVGPHLAEARSEFFVAGKTLRANPDGVEDQFDNTRRLLHADVLDLYQAHAVTSIDELNRRSEAIERIISLRDRGLTRFAGITGHDMTVPVTFLEALRRFDLDTVMFPVYPALWGRPEYREPAAGAPRTVRRAGPRSDGDQGGGVATLVRWEAALRCGEWRPSDREPLGRLLVRTGPDR